MFSNTIDNRKNIVDWNGNTILDFFPSIFNFKADGVEDFTYAKVSDTYVMRPDLVAFSYYGTTEKAEYVLLYNGISNPFSLEKDDVLMIPNVNQADNQIRSLTDSTYSTYYNNFEVNQTLAVKNAYKYISESKFPVSSLSNAKFDAKTIPDSSIKKEPYISTNSTNVVAKNGRIYFGKNTGLISAADIPTSNIEAKIEKLVSAALGVTNSSLAATNSESLADSSASANDAGSPADNLCQAIRCGNNTCVTGSCLSDGTSLSDILNGSKSTL